MKKPMKNRSVIALFLLASLLTGTLYAQFGFRRNFGPTPGEPPAGAPAEWTFARLAYDGRAGYGGSSWYVDYPGAEYHFSRAVDRLTVIDPHKEGYVVSPDYDDLFDYPWIYAVEPWSWSFTAEQATRMREYLLRGGFMMVDDFHGEDEWNAFLSGLRQIFPNRSVEDIPAEEALYQMPFPLTERLQVPGPRYMYTGVTYERYDGETPHWRGVRDDEGRWMIVASHNIDYGEGWEQADTPEYPEPFTRQAYEVGINYLIYSMTH